MLIVDHGHLSDDPVFPIEEEWTFFSVQLAREPLLLV